MAKLNKHYARNKVAERDFQDINTFLLFIHSKERIQLIIYTRHYVHKHEQETG